MAEESRPEGEPAEAGETTCRYEFNNERICHQPQLEGDADGRCILHSRNANKPKDEFQQALEVQLADGDHDYRGYTFPTSVDFSGQTIKGVWDFRRAVFLQGMQANFSSAEFAEEALADFSGARFEEGARVGFGGARFAAGAWADFNGAEFAEGARVDFGGATVGDLLWANGKWDDGSPYFQGTALFGEAKFTQPVIFEDCRFGEGSTFERASGMEHVTFRRCDLPNCTFREASHLEQAEFDDVRWAKMPPPEGRWHRFLHFWHWLAGEGERRVVADELAARKSKDYAAVERVYHQLVQSYEARRGYPEAGDFYYGEMEMRRLAQKRRWSQKFLSLAAFYWHLSGYGQAWRKAALWFLFLVIGFTIGDGLFGFRIALPDAADVGQAAVRTIQWECLPPEVPDVPATERIGEYVRTIKNNCLLPEGFGESLLYSLRTATLLRDPAIATLNVWGNLANWIESAFGPIILGLMGLAIRRKFRR